MTFILADMSENPEGNSAVSYKEFRKEGFFRNLFGRRVKLDRILICKDGRVLGFYSGNGAGVQLLNKDERAR